MTAEENQSLENKYENTSTIDTIRAMDELSKRKEELESELTKINKEYDFLRLNLVPKKMEDMGIDNVKVDGIGRVSLTSDMYVRVNADNRERVHQFFNDIGKSSIITETINASTLKAVVKSMIRSGEEIPEDLIKITPFTRASITKR
jgi:hypothetical protein